MTEGANQLTSRATFAAGPRPPVAAPQFLAFVSAFERLGYDTEALLVACGLQKSALADPDGQIPCAECGRFIGRALAVRPMANPGVRLGAATPTGTFPLLDYLALSSDDVGQAFKQVARYLRLVSAPLLIEVYEDDDPARIQYFPIDPTDRFSIEYSVTLHVFRAREETDGRAQPAFVSLMHTPDDPREVEQILGCPVHANAPWAGVAFSREAWRQPLRRPDPILRGVLQQHADEVLARLPAVDGIALDVRRAIVARAVHGDARLETVARDLAVSPRTLQRRLASAGSSFEELADRVARELAEKHLRESSLAIAEVAYLIGYSEPAAFNRAVKRWTGMTPQAFRRAARALPG